MFHFLGESDHRKKCSTNNVLQHADYVSVNNSGSSKKVYKKTAGTIAYKTIPTVLIFYSSLILYPSYALLK